MKGVYTLVTLTAILLGSPAINRAQAPETPTVEDPLPVLPPPLDSTVTTSPATVAQASPPSEPYVLASELRNVQEQQLRAAEQRIAIAEIRAQNAESNYPLLILLQFFTFPIAFAAGVLFARYKNYQRLNEIVRGLMERNVAIPPELVAPTEPTKPKMSDFRRGLLLLWSGIGLMFLLGVIMHGSRAWGLGLIPVFTGLAYLVLWRLDRRKETA